MHLIMKNVPLTVRILKIFLRSFGEMFTEPDIDGLIARFDENRNGFFEIEEFEKTDSGQVEVAIGADINHGQGERFGFLLFDS